MTTTFTTTRAAPTSTTTPPAGMHRFAYDPADDDEARRLKSAILVVAGGCTAAGLLWTAMYWVVFGWGLTAALPLSFSVIVGAALVVSHARRDHVYAVYAQIVCITYVTTFIQWSIGGLFASGFVLVWAFVGPVTALAFFPMSRAAIWFALYFVNLAITFAFDGVFRRAALPVDASTQALFFGMNVSVSSLVVFFFASYFARSAESERARADHLADSLEKERARQLGPYTLEGTIGSGGMGIVYRARHALLRRPTAVKVLATAQIGDAELRRFEREVQLTATLSHPNTVAIHDYGRTADGVFYYAMELLDGIDLETLVERTGPLHASRVVHLLTQVCGALEEAHDRGLVHRDIKPANIMACRIGNRTDVAKVLDFGLVKDLAADDRVTHDGSVAGTPAYLAPEAITDPSTVGPLTDVYAVGAVAYWLLTGRTVFRGTTSIEVCAHHVHTPPSPPSLHVDGVPPELDALVMACLSKRPADRPASTRVLASALERVPLDEAWTADTADAWWGSASESIWRADSDARGPKDQAIDRHEPTGRDEVEPRPTVRLRA